MWGRFQSIRLNESKVGAVCTESIPPKYQPLVLSPVIYLWKSLRQHLSAAATIIPASSDSLQTFVGLGRKLRRFGPQLSQITKDSRNCSGVPPCNLISEFQPKSLWRIPAGSGNTNLLVLETQQASSSDSSSMSPTTKAIWLAQVERRERDLQNPKEPGAFLKRYPCHLWYST